MSELIKGNTTENKITMTRLRTFSFLGMFFIAAILLSSNSHVTALATVYEWGIDGDPELGQGFNVWANVTNDAIVNDDDPGIKNVTIRVIGPNMSIRNLMTFNGTYYTGSVPAFPNGGTFNVYLIAYNMTDQPRISTHTYITYSPDAPEPIDPSVTMPVVVGSSVALMVIVIVIALTYDRRKSPTEV
ncbi:MAG: hypothetical protein ACFFFK_01920 [Candidatus Thorarchaeota archaeon]